MELGYFLSSEEHGPRDLVRHAQMAADAGIESVWISDHFHPWLDEQGHSPFVWSVIGGIAATTELRVTTGVTCPTMRIHPVIIAQAAATSALMLDGRFELGVGSGENLNEHVLGDRWPAAAERLDMLDEAIEVIRLLWSGDEISHHGPHYTVENARIYSLPAEAPPIVMSAFGPKACDLASRVADGFASTKPDQELVSRYRANGGTGSAQAGLKVSWGADRDACAEQAHRLWRSSGVPGELSQELRTPALFEQAAENVTVEAMGEHMPCGPDVGPIVEAVVQYRDAGFDRLYINQIGDDQEGFFEFFSAGLAPAIAEVDVRPGRT
ncbi:MAG: TIGR03557 family F420-dependent LLM class oxidoreductase [Actinobacteria bacterium]|nr:TIGR03557 family F420-dependent LLM class oxidoreductase [Actinomycetota bacterium]